MSKIAGRLGRVYVSSNGGSTYYSVNGVGDFTLSTEITPIDVTSHDSGQFREYIPGHKTGTFDFSCKLDEDDAGQAIVVDGVSSGSTLVFKVRNQEGTGEYEWIFAGMVKSVTNSSPNDDAATFDVSVQITGDFSRQTQ